jgi:ABC-type branched-subunit amino acid transport system substrate-binding protein
MRKIVSLGIIAVLAVSAGARAEDVPVLRLGLHFPETGAAPVHSQAINAGASLYWRYLHETLGLLVHGKRIEVTTADDQFSPTTAVSACDKMATEDDALILLGATGTDQINACASYADQRGIPYLSPGVQEAGLMDRHTYFALSMTYPAQSRILAEFVVNELGSSVDQYRSPPENLVAAVCDPLRPGILVDEIAVPVLDDCPPDPELNGVRIALVRQNTPNYNDTENALRSALQDLGTDLHAVYAVLKEGFENEAQQVAADMEREGIDVVITTTSPVFTLRLAEHASQGDYFPRYVMYGMTSGLNAVARIGCLGGDLQHTSAFSAWPGWDALARGEFDPSFAAAANEYAADRNTVEEGDYLVWMWGMMKSIHQILEAVGPDPARADITALLDAGYSHSTGVFPDFAVDADDHFGTDAVHRLEVDCDAPGGQQFLQRDAFVTGYPAS